MYQDFSECRGVYGVNVSFLVLDLPQLYQHPTTNELLRVLDWIEIKPATRSVVKVINKDVVRYLTSIIGSQLQWIEDEEQKEKIKELASLRLNERAGRTARPSRTQAYVLERPAHNYTIHLHEPTLTEDNLGLKTWIASHLLARKLHTMLISEGSQSYDQGPMLELGAGTGLIGITAAIEFQTTVYVTDLPAIVENLDRNVQANSALLDEHGAIVTPATLDWNNPRFIHLRNQEKTIDSEIDHVRFQVIFAADVVYEPEHARLLANTIEIWLDHGADARLVIQLPRRPRFEAELESFCSELERIGLEILRQGDEEGKEDWGGFEEESLVSVICWWSVWRWKFPTQKSCETISISDPH
jgi:predicted nicotinamide N-methyase